jgi:hypothetical protein
MAGQAKTKRKEKEKEMIEGGVYVAISRHCRCW